MIFEDIYNYINLSKIERQNHLNLEESCIEIGGHSTNFRGLLAFHLKTTIPLSRKIHLCHACNNGKCSNVNHLYWGTIVENLQDSVDAGLIGNKTPRELTLQKYGVEITSIINSKAGKKGGINNIKPKSEEHKMNISKTMKNNEFKHSDESKKLMSLKRKEWHLKKNILLSSM